MCGFPVCHKRLGKQTVLNEYKKRYFKNWLGYGKSEHRINSNKTIAAFT